MSKWLHVLGVIAAVGLHAAYGIWIVRASQATEALAFALRTIRLLDDWVALPAFVMILLSGSAMVAITRMSMMTPWMFTALVLVGVLLVSHVLVYRPTLKRLIVAVERGRGGVGGSEFRVAAAREKGVGITLVLIMIAIVFLMVVKPGLWT